MSVKLTFTPIKGIHSDTNRSPGDTDKRQATSDKAESDKAESDKAGSDKRQATRVMDDRAESMKAKAESMKAKAESDKGHG